MNQFLRDKKENIIYLILWLVLLAAPVVSMYLRSTHGDGMPFRWSDLLQLWKVYVVFFTIFIAHNFFIAPLLVFKGRKLLYFASVTCLLAVFVFAQCSTKPDHVRMTHRHNIEEGQQEKGMGMRQHSEDMTPHDRMMPPRHRHRRGMLAPVDMGPAEVINTIFLIMLLGMNIGVKLYFKNERDRKEMHELKDQNMEHQLAYLKYQINPHFFMNTLNNIHALVDIDPEKAKESIVVLSKMMRHILYEGDNEMIPLQKEIAFINNYVTLMRMRYTEKVKITLDMPQFNVEGEVPPLLLITFVENAFKHGITYEHDSFIDLHISTEDGKILFRCKNSKAAKPNQEKGGVGLSNVRKRLDLIYKSQYQLNFHDEQDTYEVELSIPAVENPRKP